MSVCAWACACVYIKIQNAQIIVIADEDPTLNTLLSKTEIKYTRRREGIKLLSTHCCVKQSPGLATSESLNSTTCIIFTTFCQRNRLAAMPLKQLLLPSQIRRN